MSRFRLYIRLFVLSFWITCNVKPVGCNDIYKGNSINEIVQQSTLVSLNEKEWKTKLQENPGTIIDIRTPDEWADGYIDRADFVNLFDQDFIGQVNKIQADKNKPLYIYCRLGNRSKEAMRVLNENGYTQIYELNNGIIGWLKEGFKITK